MAPPPPARERSRSATRLPAPAAGSHRGRREQASPRQRARTPHRLRPEKAGEHKPEWYGKPRPPMDSTTPVTAALLPAQGRQRDGTRQSDPPPYRPPPAAQTGGTAHAFPPPSPPPRTRTPRTRPAARSPHRTCRPRGQRRAPTSARPRPQHVDSGPQQPAQWAGSSGEGERLTPDAPRNSRRHLPRGRPTATPTTRSQVGGNRDRTAPPPGRQTEQGTGAGHAEGHGPRGTALPAPRAGTARGAPATPPRRGGSGRRGSASAHTHNGHAGTTRRATGPSARNAQTAGMAYQRARGRDIRT